MSALHDLPGGEAAQEELCTHEAEGDGVHDHFCSQSVGLVSKVVGVKSDRWQSEDEGKKKG